MIRHAGIVSDCKSIHYKNYKMEEAAMKAVPAVLCLFISALLVVITAINTSAQTTGTITGMIHDQTGAILPGAKVRLVLQSTLATRETTANNKGFFSFVGIRAGDYELTVEATGFATYIQRLTIHINDQIDLKQITLRAANVAASVEVSGTPEVLPSSSGEVSYTLTAEHIKNLAIVGRNAIELMKIMPGSQNSGGWNGKYSGEVSGFNMGAGAYTVNGTRFNMLAVVSDGGNVIDHGFNGGAMVTPNIEMIQEAKIQTAAYSAENPNGPIIIETITKSGTREFHGAGYYSIRDSSLNANDWQNNRFGLAKPQSRFQNLGFNLGGPVIIPGIGLNRNRDKLFFFTAFEWMRQGVDMGVRRAIVPTAEMRNGDFRNVAGLRAIDSTGSVISNFVNTSVCQGTPLPSYCSANGVISPTAISAAGRTLLNLYPLPNANPLTNGGFNYFSNIINPQPRAQQLTRIDYAPSQNTNIAVRYNHEGETVPYPYALWQTWPQIPYPGSVVGKNSSQSAAISLTSTISPITTNQVRFTMNRLFYGNTLTTPEKVSASKLGYPYYGVYNNGLDIIPNITGANGVGSIYNAGGVVPDQNSGKWTFTFSEDISRVMGTHLLKGGAYFSRITTIQRTGGDKLIDQGSITLADWATITRNGYADLLIGHISGFDQGKKNIPTEYAGNEIDFYAQDNWKIARRLSVNYGARINHLGWWYSREGYIAVFDPARYDPSAPISAYSGIMTNSMNKDIPRSGYKPVGFQFAPSGGFAFDLWGDGHTVLRGGFGTNYFRDDGNSTAFFLVHNPPALNMNYFYPWGGMYLSELSSIVPSASPPWLSTAVMDESKMPRVYSYSFSVQQKLGATMLQAAYVGNYSKYLIGWPNINPVPEGAELGIDWPSQGDDATYRKYKNIAGIYPAAHTLSSKYNSLQVTANRNKGRVNYWLSYTFSKSLGHNAGDSFDLTRTYGPLAWDRTHSLRVSYNLEIPSVVKGNKFLKSILNGWQVSGITDFTSGAPLALSGSFPGGHMIGIYNTNTGTAAWRLTGRTIAGTPDVSPVPRMICDPGVNLGPQQIFNAACFVAPKQGQNGDYRLPYINGPWYNNHDLSLFKKFKMSETRSIQFRADFFNFMNHPLWGFSSNDPALQLGVKDFGGAMTNNSAAGIMTNKFGHRTVQLSLKLYF